MKQFVIPQFIDVETKIIGFITVRQFIIMVVSGVLIFLCYKLSDFWLFVAESLIIIAIMGILAFLKVNGRPVHYFLINFVETMRRPKLKIWHKYWTDDEIKAFVGQPKEDISPEGGHHKDFISQSRLAELSLIIDTGGSYKGTLNQQVKK